MKIYNNAKELCEDYDGNFWRFGRSLYKYTPCGPWCRLFLADGRVIYYEDKGADDPALLENDATGIEIGSIVEGSDVEVGPVFLEFPFTNEYLWDAVEEINEEADFYWKRDNEDDYLIELNNKEFYVSAGWGFEYSEDTPEDVRTFFEEKWDEWEELDEGKSREISSMKVTKIDKSMLTF